MKSLWIALAMYSRLPAPRAAWEERSMAWALCWFPLVGVVIGALLLVWFRLAALLELGPVLRGAGALLLPIALSGGIHLDGLCDTADALASHQSRERKLEILKDPHTGAFALIACGCYLLGFFALWTEAEPAGRAAWVLALGPVLSRGLSGLMAVTQPNARGSGLLSSFTAPVDRRKARVLLGLWCALSGGAMVWLSPPAGLWALGLAGLGTLRYIRLSRRQFGGITGDLEGYYLQVTELLLVLAVVIAQKMEGLIL